MDGFAGNKTAATEVIPDAVTVLDPFPRRGIGRARLDLVRQRVQAADPGPTWAERRPALRDSAHRPHPHPAALSPPVRASDGRFRHRRAPRVKVAWLIYQRIIAAYSQPDRRRGKTMMTKIIDPLRRDVPTALEESPRSAAPCIVGATTCWPTSTITPPTDRPKRSTAVWKRHAETPSDYETSPTTESAHSCTAATSSNRSMHSKTGRPQKHLTIKSGYAGSPCQVTIDSRTSHQILSTTTSPHPPSYFRACSGSRSVTELRCNAHPWCSRIPSFRSRKV